MERRTFIQAGAASALTAACATPPAAPAPPPPTPVAVIPYRLAYGRRMIITASINGSGPYDFIVDTAASKTILFENVASRLSVTPSGEPDIDILGLSGFRRTPTFRIGDIDVGGVALTTVTAPILPDWEGFPTPQGVLGLDFFKNRFVVFDPDTQTVSLYGENAQNLEIIHGGWSEIILERTDFGFASSLFYILTVEMSGQRVTFLLDSGSDLSICNFAAARNLRTVPSLETRLSDIAEVGDAHGERVTSFLVRGMRLRIGGKVLLRRSLLVADTPFFEQIGRKDIPFGLFGLDNLLTAPFAIDFSQHKLFMR